MSRREELDRSIVASYRQVSRGLSRVQLPLLVERGITMAQLKALMAVNAADQPGVAVTVLGSELGIGQSSASLLVDQLVRQGLVTRTADPADRRRVLVTASAEGEEFADELRLGRRSLLQEWLGGLSDEDATALAKGMRALEHAASDDDRPV